MTTARPLLDVQDLRKSYGAHTVLDGLSFTLDHGTVAGLAGGNGAGKSTLLRCLAGLARHTGRARLNGVVLDGSPPARRLVAYVPQTVQLPDTATVAEVLALFASLRGVSGREPPTPEGFLPPPEARIGALSGGQRQRVVLAAALLGEPRLLLLDEPSANLDEEARALLWGLLAERIRAGASALVATPYLADLAGVADRTITLVRGRVAAAAVLPAAACSPVALGAAR